MITPANVLGPSARLQRDERSMLLLERTVAVITLVVVVLLAAAR